MSVFLLKFSENDSIFTKFSWKWAYFYQNLAKMCVFFTEIVARFLQQLPVAYPKVPANNPTQEFGLPEGTTS